MSQYNDENSTINAYFKEVYADKMQTLIPDGVKFLKMFKFSEREAIGNEFVQPVMLAAEAGFSAGTGAFSLNNHVASTSAQAKVTAASSLLRSALSYESAAKMNSSKKAFVEGTEFLVEAMIASMSKRLEILQLYGAAGLATVSDCTAGVITVTLATWAPGMWIGTVGHVLEAFTAVTGGSQHNGDLTISAVSLANRTLTVTGTSSAVTTGDILFFKGFRGTEQNGLRKIITNTGTLYNIDAATYNDTWAGSTYSASSGQLTLAKVESAAAQAAERGCDEEMILVCTPTAFANLTADAAALRSLDTSYKSSRVELGSEEIVYYGPTGKVRVVPSIYCWQGDAFLVPADRVKRIGATDMTFNIKGKANDKFFLELGSNAGYELRLFSNQNLFCERPSWCVLINNIVNA